MKKIKLFMAMSLDGKIAKPNDDVNWLYDVPNPEKSDYGYADFYKTIGTTIMGNNTYRFVQNMDVDFPYKDKPSYVITRDTSLVDNEDVKFISGDSVVKFVKKLKRNCKEDIWLVGGSETNALLSDAELIDELIIFIMPIIIGKGVSLFGEYLDQKTLLLKSTKRYKSGVLKLVYSFS